MAELTLGELFAGVGGFSLGFERAGFRTVWQVEWDKHCQGVLARHWPEVERYGDVRDVAGGNIPLAGRADNELGAARGIPVADGEQDTRSVLAPVDVITFGSPCQDLSVAGKRAGLDGARSGLFYEAIRIIKEMRDATNAAFPRAVIWENVAGAFSSNKGADFQAVLEALADLGCHHLEWHCLDARWFGVPQRRRRVFVTAVFNLAAAERGGGQVFPVGSRSGWHPPAGGEKGTDFANALTGGLGSGGPDAATTSAVRRLTPIECERLMSFGDDHTRWHHDGTEQADTHRYRQAGNGVVANVAHWLAHHLARIL